MFSLLHAIEDIALALEQTNEKLQQIEGIVKNRVITNENQP